MTTTVQRFKGGFEFIPKSKPLPRTKPQLTLSFDGRSYVVDCWYWSRADESPVVVLTDVETGESFEVVDHQDDDPRGSCRCSCRPARERTRCVHARALAAVGLVH